MVTVDLKNHWQYQQTSKLELHILNGRESFELNTKSNNDENIYNLFQKKKQSWNLIFNLN